MKKVCLIESEYHYEVLRNFTLSICDHCNVTIITHDYCKKNLSKLYQLDVKIVSYEEDMALADYMINKNVFDYRLATTPPAYSFYSQHEHWFQGADCLIHNMNYWLQPFKNIYFLKHPSLKNLKSLGRFIKYLPDLQRRRSKYKDVFTNYIAPSESLYENYKVFQKLKSYVRLDFQAENLDKTEKEYHQIVIPGTVNHFRDYESVFKALQELSPRIEKPIKLYLLGVNQLKLETKKYENDTFSIHTFDQPIAEENYINYLRTSDLGILPLKEEIEHMGILEKKGTSNISGGVNDFVYVGLRGLIPEFYKFFSGRNIYYYPTNKIYDSLLLFVSKNKDLMTPNQSKNVNREVTNYNSICFLPKQ